MSPLCGLTSRARGGCRPLALTSLLAIQLFIKSVRRGLRQAKESRDSVTQHDNISRNRHLILSCPQGGHLAQLLGTVCLPRLYLDTGPAGGLPAFAVRQESLSFFGWQ